MCSVVRVKEKKLIREVCYEILENSLEMKKEEPGKTQKVHWFLQKEHVQLIVPEINSI